jgi:hypothetical protein
VFLDFHSLASIAKITSSTQASLKPKAFYKVGFFSHSNPLYQRYRPNVARIDRTECPMLTEFNEKIIE